MAIQLGSAYGKVGLDVSGLINAVRTGKATLNDLALAGVKMGETMKNVGRTLTLAITLPVLAMGAASIKAASDFEETKNKAVVVFNEMADSVVENANSAATALGVSKKEYLDYASTVGAALTAGGMAIEDATKLSEQAVQHFADLASFHNTQIEDAAVAWQSAIRGQFEPIQKYFPFITNQFLITYGTANGLIDANTKELTANQRAIILNAIALDSQLNPALNDFSETSKGLANQQRILEAQFQDALIMLGQNLLPIALEVVQGLNSLLTTFNNMPPSVQKAILIFAGLLAVLGPVISFLGTIISFVSGIAGFVSTLSAMGITLGTITSALGAAGTAILGFGAAALTVIAPLLLIIATIALVYLAFKNNFMGITTTAKQLWEIIKYYFNQIVKYMRDVFTKVNWSQIGKYILSGLANGMLGGIPLIVTAATNAAKAALAAIKRTLGIASDSKETIKLGRFTTSGFITGVEQMMAGAGADRVAKSFSRPINNLNNQRQQNVTMQFASGVTLRQMENMLASNNEMIFRKLDQALGGA